MSEVHPYRAVSRSAVVSLILAAISLILVIMFVEAPALLVLPLVGAILGLSSLRTIRRYPNEYTGAKLALIGAIASLLVLIGGASAYAYIYTHEVPEGYTRVGYWELQPDRDHPELPISPKAIDLSGQRIFIKGYMHPGVATMGKVNHFILVPDLGTCCFGGDPPPTHMIEVRIPDANKRITYAQRQVKLAGTFAVSLQASRSLGMKNPIWYHLQVDEVR